MTTIDYDASPQPVRADIVATHERLVEHITSPGTWWTGAERRSIAEAARAARTCALCAARKAAISPFAIDGDHDDPDDLPPEVVDTIHRIVTDPGRLSKSWYDGVVSGPSLDPFKYVELVSVTVLVTALDAFARSMGLDPAPLPDAEIGEPSGHRPADADVSGAWVPQLNRSDEPNDDWIRLYGERVQVAQVERGLSLVPAEVEFLNSVAESHYMPFRHVPDPTFRHPDRSIDRIQTELVASRVSAINECFY